MPHDSLDKCEPEKDLPKDGRRCVLCTVEGDAESMVSTTSYTTLGFGLFLLANFTVSQCLVAGLVGGWAALALCSG